MSGAPVVVDEMLARPEVLALTPEEAATMSRGRFNSMFRRSAVMRLRLDGLRRNALHVLSERPGHLQP